MSNFGIIAYHQDWDLALCGCQSDWQCSALSGLCWSSPRDKQTRTTSALAPRPHFRACLQWVSSWASVELVPEQPNSEMLRGGNFPAREGVKIEGWSVGITSLFNGGGQKNDNPHLCYPLWYLYDNKLSVLCCVAKGVNPTEMWVGLHQTVQLRHQVGVVVVVG